jgi:predicted MFS family arabinose efflux permease
MFFTLRRWLEFSPETRCALRIDVSVTLLFTVFTGLTSPFTGLILRRDLGATPLQLSVLGSAGAACLLLSVAVARLIDCRRPLPWVVWPGFVARALFLLAPAISTPWPLVGVLVAGTALGTVMSPAQAALVQQVYPPSERGRALGTVRTAGALVGIALAVVAGQILGRLSWRWVFPVAGLVGMASSLRQRRLPVSSDTVGGEARPALAEAWYAVRDDRAYRRLLTSAFVFGSGVWLMQPATPLLLADVVQASTAQVGVLAAAAALASIGGNLVWGRLVDGQRSLKALRAVYTVGTGVPLIFAVCAVHPSLVIGASVAESLMATGLDLVWMLAVIEFAGPGRTAQYAAIASTLAGVRGVVGPLAGAALIETAGLQTLYVVAATLMATGALLVWRQARHQNTPRYIEQPRHTSGGLSVMRAARNAS